MDSTRSRLTLLTVALATFMTYLDNNIVNVAIPRIQTDLHLSVPGLEWVVSAYILVFASLLLAGGRMADVWGRRRIFLVGLGIFTVASLAAGLSGSVELLVASRAVQGLGAALVTPTALAIISATFTDLKERARAVGIWAGVGGVALAVGPLLGGLISQHLSWGWIFFINVPVGVAAMALAAWVLRESRASEVSGLDVPGLVLSAGSLFLLTYGLIEGSTLGWTSLAILGALVGAAVLATAFVLVERRAAAPMVAVSLFRERVFTGGIAAVMMWAFGLFGIYFFTSLYLQNVLGFSPTEAGLAFVPMALLMVVGAVLSDRVALRFGAHRSVSFAMALMALGIGSVALLGEYATYQQLMPSFIVIGLGGGLTTSLTASVLNSMPDDEAGVASGIFNGAREVAGLLGITVIGALLVARQSSALAAGQAPAAAFLTGYRAGLLLAAALVALGAVAAYVSLRVRPDDDVAADLQIDQVPVPIG
jgi:EmrB/QacA subfamily drug resistance transporter